MLFLQMFWSFFQVGLFSVGGGYAGIPLVQNQVVTIHNWITMQEFTDLITIAEMTPGPLAINSATFVGLRMAGVLGGIVCSFAVICPALIIVSILYFLYAKYKELPMLQSVLACLRAIVAALVGNAAWSIFVTAIFNGKLAVSNLQISQAILFVVAFVAIKKFKFNSILAMLICGIANLILSIIF